MKQLETKIIVSIVGYISRAIVTTANVLLWNNILNEPFATTLYIFASPHFNVYEVTNMCRPKLVTYIRLTGTLGLYEALYIQTYGRIKRVKYLTVDVNYFMRYFVSFTIVDISWLFNLSACLFIWYAHIKGGKEAPVL
jgi:hypothetical protein